MENINPKNFCQMNWSLAFLLFHSIYKHFHEEIEINHYSSAQEILESKRKMAEKSEKSVK